MNRFHFTVRGVITLMLVFTAVFRNEPGAQPAEKPPNLMIIFTDEQRRQAMGFWQKPEYQGAINGTSDPVITPNLDAFAQDGIVFTQGMSTHPVCSPMRAMLMSGMYASQNGVPMNCYYGGRSDLKEDAECITDVLFDAGYNTAYFGKTHWVKTEALFDADFNYVGTTSPPGGQVANKFDTYIPPGPDRHSIEYWYQVLKDNHFQNYVYSNDPEAIEGKKDGEMHNPGVFSSRHEAGTIIDYLKNTRQQRDPQKPFCVIWSLNPPHPPYGGPWDCEPESYDLYKNMSIDELLNRPNVTDRANDNVRAYFANVTSTDKYIGRVLDTLRSLGLDESTLVVFTADHGEMMGSHDRMQKNCEYEEAFGVPLIIRYPGILPHRIDDLLIGSTDLYPTFLGLMGLRHKIPASVMGSDYSDLILNPESTPFPRPRSTPYINLEQNTRGLRTDKYTLLINNAGAVRLYDNIEDPYQMKNLAFNELSGEEQEFLSGEMGRWLKISRDPWVEQNKNANLIDYSVTGVHEGSGAPAEDWDAGGIRYREQQGKLHIVFPAGQDYMIGLYDLEGVPALRTNGYGGRIMLETEGLAPGLYILRVSSGTKSCLDLLRIFR